jgi:hypothetical protein
MWWAEHDMPQMGEKKNTCMLSVGHRTGHDVFRRHVHYDAEKRMTCSDVMYSRTQCRAWRVQTSCTLGHRTGHDVFRRHVHYDAD